jgi:uncharacterized membrane protein
VNATGKERLRTGARWLLAAAFVTTGALHFSATDAFLRVMPPYLPHPRALVLVSGAAEIAGALGVLVPGVVRHLAGWGLILLLVAVFPANVHMALHPDQIAGLNVAPLLLWLRLPLQLVLIAWVWWCALAASRSEERL